MSSTVVALLKHIGRNVVKMSGRWFMKMVKLGFKYTGGSVKNFEGYLLYFSDNWVSEDGLFKSYRFVLEDDHGDKFRKLVPKDHVDSFEITVV